MSFAHHHPAGSGRWFGRSSLCHTACRLRGRILSVCHFAKRGTRKASYKLLSIGPSNVCRCTHCLAILTWTFNARLKVRYVTLRNISLWSGISAAAAKNVSRFCPLIGLAPRGKSCNRPSWRLERLRASILLCASSLGTKNHGFEFDPESVRDVRWAWTGRSAWGRFQLDALPAGVGFTLRAFTARRASPKADPVTGLPIPCDFAQKSTQPEPCHISPAGTTETITATDTRQRSHELHDARDQGWTPGPRVPSQRMMPTTSPTQQTGWERLWQA